VGAVLIASAIDMVPFGKGVSWHEILVTAFLFLTAPLSALYLAKTLLLRDIDRNALPPTGTSRSWATLDRQDET
jgi:multicomponent K+:H+ antiporter subunit G